ncbi:hypothetical protein PHJA_001534400 [Phtheirospermum japonicum]|uniref:Uncharacterized protein n=1 Tax=Phtheirospermum japonicum TaxID=374723 RepID=A0A830CHN5_9LAMI|nr:hypothetical protein PHJA_001534400 [Phtheirospermum japonicum]
MVRKEMIGGENVSTACEREVGEGLEYYFCINIVVGAGWSGWAGRTGKYSKKWSNSMRPDINNHIMDKTQPRKELTEDMTRESLIAISYGLPDVDPTTDNLPKNIDDEKIVQPMDCNGEEKYRSKLISISDSSPPEVNGLLPRELTG